MLRFPSVAGLALALLVLVPSRARAQDNPFSSCRPDDSVWSQASLPEPIAERPGAKRQTWTGSREQPVRITCNDLVLQAIQVVYEDDTRLIHATGDVLVTQPDLTLFAERAELNGATKLGTFYNANGLARIGDAPTTRSQFGTMEPDVIFHAERIEKTAPRTYRLHGGGFTTCVQASPRWEMTGSDGTIVLDKRAVLRNVVLKVKDVPLFYLPGIYYPMNKEERSTGFLLPTYGNSSYRGTQISNAFFLVLGRSQDATFYHDLFSKTGQGFGSEYRYTSAPGSQGNVRFELTNEHDPTSGGAVPASSARSIDIVGDMSQGLPKDLRLTSRIDYFTSLQTRQTYEDINTSSNGRRTFNVSLSGGLRRYRFSAIIDQGDYFYGPQYPAQRSGTTPILNFTAGQKPIGKTRIYFGANGQAAYLVNQPDVSKPENSNLWRFDGSTGISMPLSSLPFLPATGSASVRLTRWLERYDPALGTNIPVALTRQLVNLQARMTGPVLSRVFQTPANGYAERFKHLIEPNVGIDWNSPFRDFDLVVKNDGSDNIVGGTTTINYGVTNRLLARRRPPKDPAAPPGAPSATAGVVREILRFDIAQSYYSDALAGNFDPQNQSSTYSTQNTQDKFSAIRVTSSVKPVDNASADFRMEIDSRYRAIRTLGASGSLDSDLVRVTAGWSKRGVIPERPEFSPDFATHYLNAETTLHTRDNRYGGTYAMNFDMKGRSFLQQRVMVYYNSQCCGLNVDWQEIDTPLLSIPADRRFGVSFTLAGIGSFSNPFGSFGGR
jgi:LPS-assembly protein